MLQPKKMSTYSKSIQTEITDRQRSPRSGIERRFFSYTHKYIQFGRVNTAAYLLDYPRDINIYSYAY